MITDEEQKEAVEAVEKINAEIIESLNNDLITTPNILKLNLRIYEFSIYFNITTDDSLVEIPIYVSWNDTRNYDEDNDEYEHFYVLIKRKFNEIKSIINDVNL